MTHLIPRKSDRRRFLVDVNIRTMSNGAVFKAHAIDLGDSGISVFSTRFLRPGESVELEFKMERPVNGAPISKYLGSIAYARVESDGNILGIEFARPLKPQEMQALGLTR